jgi:hypothetical protein
MTEQEVDAAVDVWRGARIGRDDLLAGRVPGVAMEPSRLRPISWAGPRVSSSVRAEFDIPSHTLLRDADAALDRACPKFRRDVGTRIVSRGQALAPAPADLRGAMGEP